MADPAKALSLVLCALALGAAGCGGGDSDSDRLTEERIQKERDEAAQIARQEERVRQLEEQLKDQQGRAKRPARRPRPTPTTPTPAQPAPAPVPTPAAGSSCGDGLSVGPNTTCPFARVVREAYFNSGGGDTTVSAFSPVTGKTYLMSCSGGSPHVCAGGNNASVYFP